MLPESPARKGGRWSPRLACYAVKDRLFEPEIDTHVTLLHVIFHQTRLRQSCWYSYSSTLLDSCPRSMGTFTLNYHSQDWGPRQ
jgi:hypothetical protein